MCSFAGFCSACVRLLVLAVHVFVCCFLQCMCLFAVFSSACVRLLVTFCSVCLFAGHVLQSVFVCWSCFAVCVCLLVMFAVCVCLLVMFAVCVCLLVFAVCVHLVSELCLQSCIHDYSQS